jgi:hypothetical protein
MVSAFIEAEVDTETGWLKCRDRLRQRRGASFNPQAEFSNMAASHGSGSAEKNRSDPRAG